MSDFGRGEVTARCVACTRAHDRVPGKCDRRHSLARASRLGLRHLAAFAALPAAGTAIFEGSAMRKPARLMLVRLMLVLLALACAAPVQAADETPVLMLDTGGHMADISGVAFTPDGAYVVSASDDKTIRVARGRRVDAVAEPGDAAQHEA